MAAEELGDQNGISKTGDWLGEGDSGMDPGYVAHKSQTPVGPPRGKRIGLDCGAKEKDPGEGKGGGGMGEARTVSIISCPIFTCPF